MRTASSSHMKAGCGEPRGAKRKSQDWDQRGDCIDCKACVHVCPTGIDIREGLPDGMHRLRPVRRCLQRDHDEDQPAAEPRHLRHPQQSGRRRSQRSTARVTADPAPHDNLWADHRGAGRYDGCRSGVPSPPRHQRAEDRAPLFVTLSDGDIRNGYTFKISNMTRYAKDYSLQLAGVPGATGVIGQEDRLEQIDLAARPDTVATYRIYVRASGRSAGGHLDAGNLHADRQDECRQSANIIPSSSDRTSNPRISAAPGSSAGTAMENFDVR